VGSFAIFRNLLVQVRRLRVDCRKVTRACPLRVPPSPAVVQAYYAEAYGGRKKGLLVQVASHFAADLVAKVRFDGYRFHRAPRRGTSVEEVKNLFLAAGIANAGMLCERNGH
jgi:hypothetical protein